MKKIFVIISLFSIFGLSAARSETLTSTQNRFIDSLVTASVPNTTTGVAVGIVRNGEIIFSNYYGLAVQSNRVPITDSTRFNLASFSKQFTAMCCLILEQESKLDLDADIHTYLPELPNYGQKITVRQLLHHTSGLASTDVLRLVSGTIFNSKWSQTDEFNLIKQYPTLNNVPNAEHLYCNTGYFLLAKIIEKISGKSYEAFLNERICTPLGMYNTTVYDVMGEIIANAANGYIFKDNRFEEKFTGIESIYGSTNQYSTLNDLLKWDLALLNGTQLGNQLIEKIMVPTDTLNNGDTISYTYGFNVWNYKGEKVVEHAGFTAGFQTRNFIVPGKDFAVIVLSNNEQTGVWEIATKITDQLLGLVEKPVDEKISIFFDVNESSKIVGQYRLDEGLVLTVEPRGDSLILKIPDAPDFQLFCEKGQTFFLKAFEAGCTFSDLKDGKYRRITWHQGGKDIQGIRVEKAEILSNSQLQKLAGVYRNEVLNVNYQVKNCEGKLIITLPEVFASLLGIDRDVALNDMGEGIFYGSRIGQISFEHNKSKKIESMHFIDLGRIRNIEFERIK